MPCSSEFTPPTHAGESWHLVPLRLGRPLRSPYSCCCSTCLRGRRSDLTSPFPSSPRSCAALDSAHSKSSVPSVPSCLPDVGPISAHLTTAFRILKGSYPHLIGLSVIQSAPHTSPTFSDPLRLPGAGSRRTTFPRMLSYGGWIKPTNEWPSSRGVEAEVGNSSWVW